jgi:hypothetical protein
VAAVIKGFYRSADAQHRAMQHYLIPAEINRYTVMMFPQGIIASRSFSYNLIMDGSKK